MTDAPKRRFLLDHLVTLIYEAVSDNSRWRSFLDAFVEAVEARRGTFSLRDFAQDEFSINCWCGWSDQDIFLYAKSHALNDPWNHYAALQPEGVVSADFEYCPRHELESSLAWREFYLPRDAYHGMGGAILRTSTASSLVAVVRGKDDGPFGEPQLAILRSLMPHLRRAAILHGEMSRLRAEVAALTGHLDRSPHALLLLDAEARILWSNAAAREAAAQNDGVHIEAGRLTANFAREDASLSDSISYVSASKQQALRRLEITREHNPVPYRLLLFPVPNPIEVTLGTAKPTVAVLIIDLASAREPDSLVLRELFGLTQTEARIAGKLSSGLTLDEISDKLCISIETVRTHLRRIMGKTGAHKQGELVSLILRSIPFR